jgi:hypothetical protein
LIEAAADRQQQPVERDVVLHRGSPTAPKKIASEGRSQRRVRRHHAAVLM